MSKNTLPLHKTTHFRRLREVISELTKKANVNASKYNLENIKCYRALGKDLIGKNVLTLRTQRDRCCFVKDNEYEIYECPSTTNQNTEKAIGEFLMIAHNIDFDYWLVVILNYSVNTNNGKAYVDVKYDPRYNGVVRYMEKNEVKVQPFNHPMSLALGANDNSIYFDSGLTRATAYSFFIQQHMVKNSKNNNSKIATNEKVTVYKNKKSNNRGK